MPCLYFAHFTPSLPSYWPMESRLWHLCRHIQPISEVIFVSLFIPHFQVLLRNPSVNLTSFSNRTTFLPCKKCSFCLNSVRTGDVFCTDTKDIRGDAAYVGLHVISSVVLTEKLNRASLLRVLFSLLQKLTCTN